MISSNYIKIIDKAWDLINERGVNYVNPLAVANELSIPVGEVKTLFRDEETLVLFLTATLLCKIDVARDPHLSEQDRLFDVFMKGFDEANMYRDAIKNIWQRIKWNPKVWCLLFPLFQKKMEEIAKTLMEKRGKGQEKKKLFFLYGVLGKTFWVWREDESLDLSKTMETLDKTLKSLFIS